MTTSARKANKFLLAFVFLLTFFLVYWYGHPQLIMQKWQDLTWKIEGIIEDRDEDEVQALVDALDDAEVKPNDLTNDHSSSSD